MALPASHRAPSVTLEDSIDATDNPEQQVNQGFLASARSALSSAKTRAQVAAQQAKVSVQQALVTVKDTRESDQNSNASADPQGPTAQLATSLINAATEMGKRTKESGSAMLARTVQGIRRLTTPSRSITALCKQELRSKPCPQTLLLCCNHIVANGLHTEGIFRSGQQDDASAQALVEALEGGAVLLPTGLDAVAAAAAVKWFLSSLEDPLLTHRLADAWCAAGDGLASGSGLEEVALLLGALPAPNQVSLQILMETCARLSLQSSANGMNAHALAAELAPHMLWRPSSSTADLDLSTARISGALGSAKAAASTGVTSVASGLQALRDRIRTKSQEAAPSAAGAPTPPAKSLPLGFGTPEEGDDELLSSEDLFSEPPGQPHAPTSATAAAAGGRGASSGEVGQDEPAPGSAAEAEPTNNNTSTASVGEGHQPGAGRIPLAEPSLDALVRVLEFMILSSGDLFSARGAS